MNQASTTAAMADLPASVATSQSRVRLPKVYKTEHGEFWHFEALGRRRSSYLRTACGRRLGRWHLMPARRPASMSVEAICSGCLRKTAS